MNTMEKENVIRALHKKYGKCIIVSIRHDIATIAVDTVSEAASDADDQSLCYGLDYYDVPISELWTYFKH